MAKLARLVAPLAPPREEWPWHTARWTAMPLSVFGSGDRRLEAENYLSSGYALRLAIERKASGWRPLSAFAKVWQPLRLKGIQVGAEEGTPFLAATQVFDVRPVPRKWLAIGRTNNASERFVTSGQILVTCSGAVGRATLAHAPHEKTLVSHDLLRVDAVAKSRKGWLYAYLRAPQTRAMMSGAQYGHIIKHLEVAHLESLPVPEVDAVTAADFEQCVQRLLELRNQAYQKTLEAERLFEEALGSLKSKDYGEEGFSVRASKMFGSRRRFEANYFSPAVAKVFDHLRKEGKGLVPLSSLGFDVWLPTRFRRIPATDGVEFLDSSDIFETNPDITKRIADGNFGDPASGRVKAGWLLLARSGQTYGINGSVVLATAELEDKVVSDHVMRIAPTQNCQIRPGYLLTVLSHPVFGRPSVKALAYGSSIPEIDPTDFAAFPVVRLEAATESAIADLAEASAAARAEADVLERELAEDAGRIIEAFISGANLTSMRFATSHRETTARTANPLAEHGRVRLLKAFPGEHLHAGATGTIVHVYAGGKGFEVEFGVKCGAPRVVTLKREAIEPLMD